MNRDRVIELARSRAPAIRVADTRVDESRGRLTGARALLAQNPVLEMVIGPRWAAVRSTDYELAIGFPIELGGRRSKRIAVAEAGVDRDQSLARDSQRVTVGAALAGYYRVLHSEARLAVARDRKALADELLRTASERQKAGDAAQLEVNLADSEASRAESEISSAQANVARARAGLAMALGFSSGSDLKIEGDLNDRSLFDSIPADPTDAQRPDVLAARAEVTGVGAEVSLADTLRWPDLSFRVSYAHAEDGQDILLGGFAITLPFFERGQGPRQETRARRQRAEIELSARKTQVSAEVEAACTAYQAAVEAVRRLEEKGLPLALQNEDLARQSYQAGKIDLTTLLVVRREVLDTRREDLDRLLDAALAGVDLAVAVGALP